MSHAIAKETPAPAAPPSTAAIIGFEQLNIEFIVPFSEYTLIGCDNLGAYFNQWLNGFYRNRDYKILLKLKTDDGQEQIFDDNFKFTVERK